MPRPGGGLGQAGELAAHHLRAAEPVPQDVLLDQEGGGPLVAAQHPLAAYPRRDRVLDVVAEVAPLLVGAQHRPRVVLGPDQPGDPPAAVGAELQGPLVQGQAGLLGAAQHGALHAPPLHPHSFRRAQGSDEVGHLAVRAARLAPGADVGG